MVAPAANAVEILKRESGRIDQAVAGRARFGRAVFRELLTDRFRASNVGIDRRDVIRWRRRRRAEDPVQHPSPAQDGRGRGPVGSDLEHARHRQDATAMTPRWSGLLLELPAIDSAQTVMLRESAVHHDEVGRDEIREAEVVLEDLFEEQFGLADHRHLEQVIELGIENVAGFRRVDLPQTEPLADEVLGERRGSGAFEHPFDLMPEHVRLIQFLPIGEREQFVVRHGAPEEVRKSVRQRVIIQLPGAFAEEQEIGRDQHALESGPDRLLKRMTRRHLLLDDLEIGGYVVVRRLAAERPCDEGHEHPFRIHPGVPRDHFASVAVVRVEHALGHVAEESAVALGRPDGIEGAFHFDVLKGQSRTVPLLGTNFVDRGRIHQAIRQHHDRGVRLHVPLDHELARRIGRGVVVAHEAAFPGQLRPRRGDAERHRLSLTLERRRRESPSVFPALVGPELRRPRPAPFRRAKANDLAVLQEPIDVFVAPSDRMTILDAPAVLRRRWRLGAIGDRHV